MSTPRPHWKEYMGIADDKTLLEHFRVQAERYVFLRSQIAPLQAEIVYITKRIKLAQAELRLDGQIVELPEGMK